MVGSGTANAKYEFKSIKLKGNAFRLRRELDQMGDESRALKTIDPTTGATIGELNEVHIGGRLLIGVPNATRWWLTSIVTEFLEVSDDLTYLRFKTKNSIYTLRAYADTLDN